MFYPVLTTDPGLIILHQGFAKCWCCAEQVRDACGAFAESVRIRLAALWQGQAGIRTGCWKTQQDISS